MRFSVLGPLSVDSDDGAPIALTRPSQRSTMAVLLCAQPRPTRAQLIDGLWGESLPGDPETALRVRICDLRRSLAGHDRVITHQFGYGIRVDAGELDTVRFRDLAGRGRAALDGGDAEKAVGLFREACDLWREPHLIDLPDTPTMRHTACALLEHRRDVQEWLIDARLALGQHYAALDQIRSVVAAEPLAEHSHVQLMLALYRCGQKSAALATYTRLRDITSREFGQDPGPEAQALLRQMLTDSHELMVRPRLPGRTRALDLATPGSARSTFQ